MMPIRDVVIFPYMMTPFVVGRQHQILEDHAQAPGSDLSLHRELRNRLQGVVCKLQFNIFKLEQLLILPHDRVLGLGQNLD